MAFFQDERPSRQPFLNAPVSVLALISVLLVSHAARVMAPQPWPEFLLFKFAFIPARYSADVIAARGLPPVTFFDQVIPFISYMFLHGDYFHVAINSLWLLAFGPIVAKRLKTARFLLFFAFCGIIAAAVHLAVYFGAAEQVVGASGAVSGLMGAGMRILYGRLYFSRDLTPGSTTPLAPLVSRPIVGFTLVWVFVNVVAGVVGLGLTDETAVIAWVAHLGGYFAGLFAIDLFDRFSFGARGLRAA